MHLPLNKTTLETMIFIVLLYLAWNTTAHFTRFDDIYHSSLSGIVEDIHTNYRNRSEVYIVFQGTEKPNQLSLVFNKNIYIDKNVVMKGDSIFKEMYTKGYDVYRKVDGEYVFLYHINTER